jgi:hypothetical protein
MRKYYTIILFCLTVFSLYGQKPFDINTIEYNRVLKTASAIVLDTPVTVTAFHSDRSSGGLHDYFSEGDYWWSDPKNPTGPYVQNDGMSNPNNFNSHRQALIQFSVKVAALTSAYKITHERKYADAAIRHLKAWFVDEATKMSPHLLYAQAVKGKAKGRGVGIIDTIHLIEIAKSIETLELLGTLSHGDADSMKKWFKDYVDWMMSHPNGKEEMNAKNNHGTCFTMQIAAFAKLLGNDSLIAFAKDRFKNILMPNQMAADGSFPLELKRTKPYSYSLFNLDAMCMIAQILTDSKDNLWNYQLSDGRSLRKAIAYMYPFIKDKSTWKLPPDVMYFNDFPVRQVSLLFGGLAYKEEKYLELWRTLDADSQVEEVIRNFPIRQPVLWLN